MNINIKTNYESLEMDSNKPMKVKIIENVSFSVKRKATYINCGFIYLPDQNILLRELIHLGQLSPYDNYPDPFQPLFVYEEDQEKIICRNELDVQCEKN